MTKSKTAMSKYYYAVVDKKGKITIDADPAGVCHFPAIYTHLGMAQGACADWEGETIKRILISDLTKLLKK